MRSEAMRNSCARLPQVPQVLRPSIDISKVSRASRLVDAALTILYFVDLGQYRLRHGGDD